MSEEVKAQLKVAAQWLFEAALLLKDDRYAAAQMRSVPRECERIAGGWDEEQP